MGTPPRSLAADAYARIMVGVSNGPHRIQGCGANALRPPAAPPRTGVEKGYEDEWIPFLSLTTGSPYKGGLDRSHGYDAGKKIKGAECRKDQVTW
jgi:hypothetical protein